MNACGYSLDGFKAAFKYEDAFRQEVFLAVVLIPLALYLEHEALHRILMIGSVLLMLIVELLNSAVEAVVDRVSIEQHALAKRAKDIASAAVFVALANVVMTWGLILMA
jgi:diacylglycerol kinase (ATP)